MSATIAPGGIPISHSIRRVSGPYTLSSSSNRYAPASPVCSTYSSPGSVAPLIHQYLFLGRKKPLLGSRQREACPGQGSRVGWHAAELSRRVSAKRDRVHHAPLRSSKFCR